MNEAPASDLDMLDKWDPMSEDYVAEDNTLRLNPDQEPECVVTGLMTEDIMIGKHKVCQFYLRHGTCADGNYCSRLHIEPAVRERIHDLQREHEMSTSRTRMISSYLSPIAIKPDERALMLVTITMIQSPTKFYVVAPYEQMNFAEFMADEIDFYIGRVQNTSSFKTKLSKFHQQLACLFDHNYRMDNIKDAMCIGQIVACKLDDGRFCRAMILDNRDKEDFERIYKLFLLDVGIEVELPREAIYEIRASCLSEPPMAIPCRLALKPAANSLKWSPEAQSLFETLAAEEKYLLCSVKSYREQDDIFTVDLFSIKDRISITDTLLANNWAERLEI